MAQLPTITKEGSLFTRLEQWRQRLQRVLPNEEEVVKEPENARFSIVDSNTVRFSFDPSQSAAEYEIQWGQDPEFKRMKSVLSGGEGSYDFDVPIHDTFACEGKYYFRVRGVKNGFKSKWTPTAVFGAPTPAALLNFFGEHAVDNVTDENPLINLKMVLPRTATIGGNTITDHEAIWVDRVEVEADWSTIDGAIDDSTTTINVATGTGPYFKPFGFYKIEDEIILVNSVATDTLTVQRGVLGTTPASHADTTTIKFFARLLREQFSAAENGTYSVVLTIPNPEKVRSRTFTATPYNRCDDAGPSSMTTVSLLLPLAISDLAADPQFQKVVLTWSELAGSAYRYQIFHSTTGAVQIDDPDPTTTGDTTLLARPLADHEGEAQFVHNVTYDATVTHFYGVRAIDILDGVGPGDTVGPLQPDQFATQAAPDVTNISATEGPTALPEGVSPRARIRRISSVTCGFDPPTAVADPNDVFKLCRIYMQATGTLTTLGANITDIQTTMTVASGDASIMQRFRLYQIDSEVIEVTDIDYTTTPDPTLTIVRGVNGTTPASHTAGAAITAAIQPIRKAEGPTAPLQFTEAPIGEVTLYFVSVSKDDVENNVLSSPNLTITLDAKVSAPLEVQNLRGLKMVHGGRIFWDEGLEPDLLYYQVADLGSRTLVNQTDIGNEHIVATVPANPGDTNKVVWDWIETLYRGKVTTGSSTITLFGDELREDQFDPVGSPAVKETLDFVTSTDTDVSDTSYDIDDTNKSGTPPNEVSTIVLASVPTEASANSTVEFYIGGRAHKFYVRAVNISRLASEWRPVEGTFLELLATAPDGTNDIGIPLPHVDLGTLPITGTSHASPGWFRGPIKPGFLRVGVWAAEIAWDSKPGTDSDPDFSTALKRNINGITDVEIQIEHSEDGATNLETESFKFPTRPIYSDTGFGNYVYQPRPVDGDYWKVNLGTFEIPLSSKGIPNNGVKVRVKNYFGWSALSDPLPWDSESGSTIQFTGPEALQPQQTETPDGVNEIFPNLSQSKKRVIENLSADATVKQPEYRSDGITKGTATQKAYGGEEFTIIFRQPASPTTLRSISFDANYVGLEGKPPAQVNDWYTAWTFEAVDATTFVCTGYVTGQWPN